MNFELSGYQQALQESALDFTHKEFTPNAAKWDLEKIFPIDSIRKAGELGFCSLYTPEEAGGLGLSRLDSAIIFEALSEGCTSTTAYITIHNMAGWMVANWGTPTIKNQWCEKLTTGESLASYCLTEPGAGSDAAALRTSAELVDDHYILNGSKIFISGAGATNLLVVMARTGGPGARGVSAFVVPANIEGISYGKNELKMGWNSQPTKTITFDNVRIPIDHLLGNEGDGFYFAMQGLDGGRVNIAACSVGTAQAALNAAKRYMSERQQFGKFLSEFQALQFKLADMQTQLVAARTMVYLAASKIDNNSPDKTSYCAMAKQFATDTCFNICNDALQIHGGYGYLNDYSLERHVRDLRVHQILEGTNEIMRLIISRYLLTE